MDYSKIEQYEYKAPSYELRTRSDSHIDYSSHQKNRRYSFDKKTKLYRSAAKQKNAVSMLFAGDLLCQEKMLQKHATATGFDFSVCFEYIKPLLNSVDLAVGNLETPIAHTAPIRGEILSHEGPYFCNAPIEYLEALSGAGFDMLTTENNHTLDAGARGLMETIENVQKFGIIQTGTSAEPEDKFVVVDVCGFKVGFAAFGTKYNSMSTNLTKEGQDVLLNTYSKVKAKKIYNEIKKRGAEYVVCFPHWGKEYTEVLTPFQQNAANSLTEIGYDLVVGAHSHVVQKFTKVNNKPVLFSLGNLMSHLNSGANKYNEYTVMLHLELVRNSNGAIEPNIDFVPCKIVRNFNNIPFSVLPVNEDLKLTEAKVSALKGTTQIIEKRLAYSGNVLNTSLPILPEIIATTEKSSATLQDRVSRLIKTAPPPVASDADIPQPACYLWDDFLRYHTTRDGVYKIYSDYAELVMMTRATEIVTLPNKTEDLPIKSVHGCRTENTTTRLVYLGALVETVEENAFCDYVCMESVRLFNHLKTIKARAFANCSSMTGVILPNSLTELGDEAFAGCTSLLTVKIPPNVTKIGNNAFAGCDKLTIYCEKGSFAEKYAYEKQIPYRYMPLDPNYSVPEGKDYNPGDGWGKIFSLNTIKQNLKKILPVSAPKAEVTQKSNPSVVLGPMNGPGDKFPASIIATCYHIGKPLPASATYDHMPSYYLGLNAFDGKLQTIVNLLGDRMPDIDSETLETAYKRFRYRFKHQHYMTYNHTDFTIFFCDWLMYARDRGFIHSDYFEYELYRKEPDIRDTFLNEGYRSRVRAACNKRVYEKVFRDKEKFNATFKKYVHRDFLDASNCSFEEFEAFVKKHDSFFAKPIQGSGGAGARVIESDSDTVQNLYKLCSAEGLILETIIKQHAELAEFNPSTLNTVRVNTLLCADGIARVMLAVGRFGRVGSVADNFHSGGVTAIIDVDTGVVITEAIDMTQSKTSIHPDSKKAILGFRYPEWEKLKAAVCDAAQLAPNVRHVGWDVAITQNGDIEFVEGNCRPNFDVLQVPDQIGRRFRYAPYILEIEKQAGIDYEELEPLTFDLTGMETK